MVQEVSEGNNNMYLFVEVKKKKKELVKASWRMTVFVIRLLTP